MLRLRPQQPSKSTVETKLARDSVRGARTPATTVVAEAKPKETAAEDRTSPPTEAGQSKGQRTEVATAVAPVMGKVQARMLVERGSENRVVGGRGGRLLARDRES